MNRFHACQKDGLFYHGELAVLCSLRITARTVPDQHREPVVGVQWHWYPPVYDDLGSCLMTKTT